MLDTEQDQVKSEPEDAGKATTGDATVKTKADGQGGQGVQGDASGAATGGDQALAETAPSVKTSTKKRKKTVSHVLLKVTATFNNTMITVTDAQGNTLAWASAGQHFKGSRKRTPFAAETAAQSLIDKLRGFGVRTIDAVLKGAGPGRDAAVKPFGAAGFQVLVVRDATPVPHNGCRPPKVRRT